MAFKQREAFQDAGTSSLRSELIMGPFCPEADRRRTRESIGIGDLDHLLKSGAKDKLAQALRHVADSIEREAPDPGELEETMRSFAEAAFLHGIMLGEHFGERLAKYRELLRICEPFALVAAVAFLPAPGTSRPEEDARRLLERFKATIRNQTTAFAGPLVVGHALVLLPIPDMVSEGTFRDSLRCVLTRHHSCEFTEGLLRMGFGHVKPMAEAAVSWREAVEDLRNLPFLPTLEGCRINATQGSVQHHSVASACNRCSPMVSRAVAFVHENYERPINLESTASFLGVAPSRLSRLFSREMGQRFLDYLIELRINKAKKLLALPGMSIKEVSPSCGYEDPNYFSRLFKKVTGTTPSAFARGAKTG